MIICDVWNKLKNYKTTDCNREVGACRGCSKLNEHHFLLCPGDVSKTFMANLGCSSRILRDIHKNMCIRTREGRSGSTIKESSSTADYIAHQGHDDLSIEGSDTALGNKDGGTWVSKK